MTYEVAIVGGGISGFSLFQELKSRNIQTCLIETEKALGQKASGNPQAILMPLVNAEPTPLSGFSLEAFNYSTKFYKNFESVFYPTGVLQLSIHEKRQRRIQKAFDSQNFDSQIIQKLSIQETKDLSKLNMIACESVYFPTGGWVDTEQLFLNLDSENIFKLASVEKIQKTETSWSITCNKESNSIQARNLVLANSYWANALLPIDSQQSMRPLRGQVIKIKKIPEFKLTKQVVCFDGYITPEHQGSHLLGGTYDRKNQDDVSRREDTEELISKLQQTFPKINTNEIEVLSERASCRATTPDHFPIVGALNSERNLFLFAGMGSRGFSFAPYASQLLADQIEQKQESSLKKWETLVRPNRFHT